MIDAIGRTVSMRQTRELLERFHAGDRSALSELLQLHYDWIREQIHRRLNPDLRLDGNTNDYLHDLIVNALERGPRFVVNDEEHFRRLVLVMIRNILLDGGRRIHAKKRDRARERRMPTQGTVLYLDADPPRDLRGPTMPDVRAARDEEQELARLAMELIPGPERRVIEMQQEESMTFEQIGKVEGITAEGARKRFHAGVKRLRHVISHLRNKETLSALKSAGG